MISLKRNRPLIKNIGTYIAIILLASLLSLSYTLYIIPNDFAPSGLNGVAVLIQYKLNFSVGYMSLLFNVPLCLLSFFLIDKKFAVKTFTFCVAYSVFYLWFSSMNLESFKYYSNGVDTIYPVIISGVIGGFICGVLLKMNACSGGTDTISRLVEKAVPECNFFWVTFALNALVALSSYFVYAQEVNGMILHNYKPVCLCLLHSFISSFVGNKIITGSKKAYKFIIITEHTEQIEKEITEKLKHSATKMKGTGIYSGSEKEVLISVVNKHQIADFENVLKKYDNTFAFVETADNILGNFNNVK